MRRDDRPLRLEAHSVPKPSLSSGELYDLPDEETRETMLEQELEALSERIGGGIASQDQRALAESTVKNVVESLPKEQQSGIQLGEMTCGQFGCKQEVIYDSMQAYMQAHERFVTSPAALEWQGNKVKSGPLPLEDGRVASQYFLYF